MITTEAGSRNLMVNWILNLNTTNNESKFKVILFSYFEYVGNDYEGDMKAMGDDPKTQEWWDVCMPLQRPVNDRADGEWWAAIPEVFHVD